MSVRITDLPAAPSVSGGDLVPVVQNGVTYKASVTQLITPLSVSVGLTMPGGFSIVGSPVTDTGTIAVTTSMNGIVVGDGAGNLTSWPSLPIENGGTGLNALGSSTQVLRVNVAGTALEYATVAGTGDVVGPTGSADGVVVLFDGTSGKAVKESTLTGGVIKATSGALSAAVAGTDYAAPNQTMYVGSTALTLNRDSAPQALTGITSIDGSAASLTTARTIDGQSFNGTANVTVIAPGTHTAPEKSTPIDADEVPLVDTADTNLLKRVTWANVKATLKAYFDTLYEAVGTAAGAISTHAALQTGVHGLAITAAKTLTVTQSLTLSGTDATTMTFPSSTDTVVGVAASQTLTTKTISVDSNVISGLAASSFVLSNVSGYLDGSAAQKVVPAGAVVGDSDSQTLTNKTIGAFTLSGTVTGGGNTINNVVLTGGTF